MKSILLLWLAAVVSIAAVAQPKTNIYPTSAGNIEITLIGHGSLSILFNGKVIHIDPYTKAGDYTEARPGDLILITHEHADHFDPALLKNLVTPESYVITSKTVAGLYDRADMYMENGDVFGWEDIRIEAVPAYNIRNLKENGEAYHPKGRGNGYVLTFGDFTVYIAGDTEPIPEMNDLPEIDVAFLPKNLPYTMSDEQFVEAAKIVRPDVLYPYHYNTIDWLWLRQQLPDIVLK